MLDNVERKFDEEAVKELFDAYHSDKGSEYALSSEDLTRFLFDLLEANGFRPIVPQSALTNVLKTLVLNYDSTKTSVTYIEWKSFYVYLQSTPLKTLLEKATEPYGDKLKVCRFYQLTRKTRHFVPDMSDLEEITKRDKEDPVYLALDYADYNVFVAEPGVSPDEEGELACLQSDAVTTHYNVQKVELTHFPPMVIRQFGDNKRTILKAASTVAGAYVTSKLAVTKKLKEVDEWDSKTLNVKSTVKDGWRALTGLWASTVGPTVETTVSTMGRTVEEKLESTGVKASAQALGQKANEAKNSLLQNPIVSSVHQTTMQTLASTAEIHKATKRQINEQLANAAPAPVPDAT